MTLTRDDRDNVAIALTTFAEFGDIFMAEFRSASPPEDSLMQVWGDDGAAGDYIVPAFVAINAAMLSGADHLRSLNHLAGVAPTSSVTVARGAVEAYAHPSHLATAEPAAEFADRPLSAVQNEYRYLVENAATLTALNGDDLDHVVEQAKVKARRHRIGRGNARPIGAKEKANNLWNRATAGTSGAHVYSGLSSVAHAQVTGVGAFVSASDTEVAGLTFDREGFVNLVFIASAAAGQALIEVARFFGGQPAHRSALDQADHLVSRARTALVGTGA